jgi:hypothetical protein
MNATEKLKNFFKSTAFVAILCCVISISCACVYFKSSQNKIKQQYADKISTLQEAVATLEADNQSLNDTISKKEEALSQYKEYYNVSVNNNWQAKANFYDKYIVVTTPTGECYHEFSCRTVNTFYAKTFNQAKAQGYRACSLCDPDSRIINDKTYNLY